jgi:hypothetical protein
VATASAYSNIRSRILVPTDSRKTDRASCGKTSTRAARACRAAEREHRLYAERDLDALQARSS